MGDGLSDVMEHYLATESPTLLLGFHVAWIFLSNIVLINLLIAMMAKTFDEDSTQVHALWFFPFAARILRFERTLTDDERRRYRSGTPAGAKKDNQPGIEDVSDDRYIEVHVGEVDDCTNDTSAAPGATSACTATDMQCVAQQLRALERRLAAVLPAGDTAGTER